MTAEQKPRRSAAHAALGLSLLASLALAAGCSGGGASSGGEVNPGAASNRAPVAAHASYDIAPGEALVIRVLAMSTDPDNDALEIVFYSQPEFGSVTWHDNGTATTHDDYLVYASVESFAGTTSFDYTISDGSDGRATGRIEITVGAAGNTPPSATSDSVITAKDTVVVIDALANDLDLDGDALHIAGFSSALIGTVTLDDGGTRNPADDRLLYTPAPGFEGADSFIYDVSDGAVTVHAAVNVWVGAPAASEQVCGFAVSAATADIAIVTDGVDNGVVVSSPPLNTIPGC